MFTPLETERHGKLKTVSDDIRKRIKHLIGVCSHGNAEATAELRRAAAMHPKEFVKEIGLSMATYAKLSFVINNLPAMGDNEEYRQDRQLTQMNLMAVELAGPNPSPACRLAAEVCSFCYLEHWLATLFMAHGRMHKEHPLLAKRRSAAHRRFMTSLRTLTQIKVAEARPRRMTVKFAPKPGESAFSGVPSMAEAMAGIRGGT